MDYVRQRFWRGYVYTDLQKLNRDAAKWLDTVANRRRHGTHGELINDRWQREIPLLTPLPRSEYDTAIKITRKVYKDCQLSYNGNRYIVPYRMVGKKVMLKIKNGSIRIYDDQDLLVTYQEPREKHQVIGNRLFYEQLKRDRHENRGTAGGENHRGVRLLFSSATGPG